MRADARANNRSAHIINKVDDERIEKPNKEDGRKKKRMQQKELPLFQGEIMIVEEVDQSLESNVSTTPVQHLQEFLKINSTHGKNLSNKYYKWR